MWVDNVVLFLFTLTSSAGSTAAGETGEEANKLTSPAVITVYASRMLWLEKEPMSPHARR